MSFSVSLLDKRCESTKHLDELMHELMHPFLILCAGAASVCAFFFGLFLHSSFLLPGDQVDGYGPGIAFPVSFNNFTSSYFTSIYWSFSEWFFTWPMS
jgi:hypothetical protein